MATDYLALPLGRLIDDSAARSATPGGGVAGVVAALLGVSMARMAASFTTGPKWAGVEPQISAILAQLAEIDRRLRVLIVADQEAFAAMLGKSTPVPIAPESAGEVPTELPPAERAARVPLRAAELAAEALVLARALHPIANPRLMSDVDVALILLDAAVRAAAVNVRINLPMLPADTAEAIASAVARLA